MKTRISFALLASVLIMGYSSCKKEVPFASSPSLSDPQYSLELPSSSAHYYNSSTPNINDKATLGRVLFYDGHLSANNAISCGSCHKQELAFADNVPLSLGYQGLRTRRNSPPIQNLQKTKFAGGVGFVNDTVFTDVSALFWDGRETNVRDLIFRPISNHVEMGMEDINVIPGKLAKLPYYADLFTRAFGSAGISRERINEAMALFISSIQTGDSRFEQFNSGKGTLSLHLRRREEFYLLQHIIVPAVTILKVQVCTTSPRILWIMALMHNIRIRAWAR